MNLKCYYKWSLEPSVSNNVWQHGQ